MFRHLYVFLLFFFYFLCIITCCNWPYPYHHHPLHPWTYTRPPVAWIQDVHGSEWGCDHCPIYVSFITSYRTHHITKVSTYYLSLLPPLGGGCMCYIWGGGLVLMRHTEPKVCFRPESMFWLQRRIRTRLSRFTKTTLQTKVSWVFSIRIYSCIAAS